MFGIVDKRDQHCLNYEAQAVRLVYSASCNSIRTPVIKSTMAKIFFSIAASNLAAREAPTGANNTVSGTIQIKPIKFTKPKVPAGASVGVLPNSNIVNAPGKEIINPMAAAVPTALCAG